MATITPSLTHNQRYIRAVWSGVATGDTIMPLETDMPADCSSVHIFGTFGGATVTLDGTLDETNYVTLLDHEGNAISKTAEAVEGLRTGAVSYRPSITGGTGDSVTLVLVIWL